MFIQALRQSDTLRTLVHVPGGSSGSRLAHPIDRTNVTHIMTSTRRLRRVESENQIWMVIQSHCAYENKTGKQDTDKITWCDTFFLRFVGKAQGCRVGTEVRETTREGIRWEVVHAPRDSLKGTRNRKEEGEKASRVGVELGRWGRNGQGALVAFVVCVNYD